MNKFIDSISNLGYTENGALTHSTSGSSLVDFFFMGGALREETDENRIKTLFSKAYNEDPLKALRVLFYLRDIRGGQGERRVFRICLKEFLINHNLTWFNNEDHIKLIPEYGRWDDVISLIEVLVKENKDIINDKDKELRNNVFWKIVNVLNRQLESDSRNAFCAVKDKNSGNCSLLAKWMPSEKSKDKAKRLLAKRLIKTGVFGKAKDYREMLVQLRNHLNIVETALTDKDYEDICYSKLPSKAALKYKSAFIRNDEDKYTAYLESLRNGETKVNTGALVPYDIVHQYLSKYIKLRQNDLLLEAAWKALPDYMGDMKGLVIADVSGSMYGTPLEVCLALAIYIAEHNKNEAFKDTFITFSSHPTVQKLSGSSLQEKLNNLQNAQWNMSTDFQQVFDIVLDRAKQMNVPQEDMPNMLIAISDMEFNEANGLGYGFSKSNVLTNFELIDKRYKEAGYERPTLVFWNVDSRQNNVPVTVNDEGVILVSGYSPVILKQVLNGLDNKHMIAFVNDVIEQERYKAINL